MEYPFSSKEKDNDYSTFSRRRMEDVASRSTENSMHDSNLEDSLNDVAEQMNFDTYAGWYNSPSNLSDQMFQSFASTSFSPFDDMNFTHQYNPGISIVDYDMIGTSLISGDSQIPLPTDCADDACNSNDTRNKRSSQHNIAGDVGGSVIQRPLTRSLAEKMLIALDLFKESSGGGILAQLWVPVKDGYRYILSTCEQPYLLDQALSGYREVSRLFTFAAETKPGCVLGLPGRVFASKNPEWTSNVVYYNKTEYLRVRHAVDHEVRGSIALPVFEDNSLERSCCAVLELVTMKERSNFDLEMENVCRALEAVNLRSVVPSRLHPQDLSKDQMAVLAEITDVLRVVCYAHRLPLALTWIPCSCIESPGGETIKIHTGGYRKSVNKKSLLCVKDTACYVNDKNMEGFVHACVEHYLDEGQGVVGKALQSNHPFFYADVKEYDISEYPLVHHARKYGLNAAVAIRLKSIYTGDDDYILEFFLPVDMRGGVEQQLLLNNLSSTMQRICKSLRTVSDTDSHGVDDAEVKLQNAETKQRARASLSTSSEQGLVSGNLNVVDPVNQCLSRSMTTKVGAGVHVEKPSTRSSKHIEKRSTTEKNVSLSVLQQYFSGSLKDAAKSIGGGSVMFSHSKICPTTLKRICRQHGISRWPSRKINKVNRSLKKIQSVLDSVKGVEGGLKFDPTIEGLVPSGTTIREFKSRHGLVLPEKNEPEFATSIGTDVDATTVKIGKESPEIASLDARLSNIGPISLFSKEISVDSTSKSRFIPGDASSAGIGSSNGSETGSMVNDSSSSFSSSGNCKIERNCEYSGSKIVVKATYKEDTVRFKFEPADGCVRLYEQVAKRFKLQIGQFRLKYLDDEEEWVMLVGDSDLQECLEILDLVGTRNVKFLVRDVSTAVGSSGGSNCFLGEGY